MCQNVADAAPIFFVRSYKVRRNCIFTIIFLLNSIFSDYFLIDTVASAESRVQSCSVIVPKISCQKLSAQDFKEKHGSVAFNPFDALTDDRVKEVFIDLLKIRLDVRRYGAYDFMPMPSGIRYQGMMMGIEEYAEAYIKDIEIFLEENGHRDPHAIAIQFHKRFGENPFPSDVFTLFKSYMPQKTTVCDVPMIKDALIPNSTIVDIGAGRFDLAKAILDYSDKHNLGVQRIIGTDIIDWRNAQKNDDRISFSLQSSPAKIDIPTASVDVVIMKWMLHHMEHSDQQKMIQEAKRVLRRRELDNL